MSTLDEAKAAIEEFAPDTPNQDTPNAELVELFLYHFGVDLREAKYYEARYELAEYFGKQISRSVAEFYKHTTGIDLPIEGLKPSAGHEEAQR